MILDDRRDADDIAFELNRRGQEVDVVELLTPSIELTSVEEPAG
jgi:hypothetical protein